MINVYTYLQRDNIFLGISGKGPKGTCWNIYQVSNIVIQPESLFRQLSNLRRIQKSFYWLPPCQSSKNKVDADTFLEGSFLWPSGESQQKIGGCQGELKMVVSRKALLGGGFKYSIFYFHPYLGKIPILTNFFGWIVGPLFLRHTEKKRTHFLSEHRNSKVFLQKMCLVPYGWTYKCYNIVSSCQSLTLRSNIDGTAVKRFFS